MHVEDKHEDKTKSLHVEDKHENKSNSLCM